MGSNPIYKTIDEYSQNAFKAYKTWTMTESTITQYSSSVNEAIYISASVWADPVGANASGISKRSLFSSIYGLYYQYPTFPFNAFGGNVPFQDRDISHRAVVVEIDNGYIGERIKPGSITISDDAVGSIKDDGFGNLLVSSDTTTYVPSSSLVGFWNFNDGFITSGNFVYSYKSRNHALPEPSIHLYDVRYQDGIVGSKVTFDGTSGSYGVIDDYRDINFRVDEDFAVSLWVWIPTSQSMTPVIDNSILEKWEAVGGYPFVIRVFNQTHTTAADIGKIYCATWDTSNGAYIQSSSPLTGSVPHHIVYQKRNNGYELYVDGVLDGTTTIDLNQIHNNSKLYVGCRGWDFDPYTLYNFEGSVDELRVYSGSLSSAQISTLYSKPSNTNIIGNVFYSHGILVFTDLSGSKSNVMLAGSNFTMNYKSTVTITENNVLATVTPNEFNMTLNPTIATVHDAVDMTYRNIVTGSSWSPYVTTIGLYDDELNLLMVAKLSKPLKKPTDIPLTFAIKWDSQ